jgi:glycosyltransferase involved in cell wall biosynthesis
MKVSIITVCLNSARTVRRALQSAMQQTYRPIEVVVVDGKSSDDTLAIVSEFHQILGRVVSETDESVYEAMNKGISLATGDIIYFLNSDDELADSEVIADVVKQFRSDTSLEMLFGDAIFRGVDIDQYRTFRHVSKHNIVHRGICHQVIFARQTLFDELGGFNTIFRINADFDWIIRVFLANRHARHFQRVVARFYAGGVHQHDLASVARERRQVQRQYQTGIRFWVGHYRARAWHHFRRLLYWPGIL